MNFKFADFVKLVPGKLPTYVGSRLFAITWVITDINDNQITISNETIDMYVTEDQICKLN